MIQTTFDVKEMYFVKKGFFYDPGLGMGWGNGYIVLPSSHPCFNQDIDYLNFVFEPYGGFTLDDLRFEGKYRLLGFDTARVSRNSWSRQDVIFETERLYKLAIKLSTTLRMYEKEK